MNTNNKNKKTGFTLIEMLMYVALMTIIILVIVQSITVVLKSNRSSFADINIRNSGYTAMEGILREIRSSETVEQASMGILEMKQDNLTRVVRFSTSSEGTIDFYEGSDVPNIVGPLTSKGVFVKNLIFTKINTGKSFAVRIEMELETNVNDIYKSEWFYGTAILRGSY